MGSAQAVHYFLKFDDNGRSNRDPKVFIDFEMIARHLLVLDANARKQGMKISKVIIKIELKDELYSGTYGKKLKQSGIYVVRGLTPTINALHDEHYHVDFAPV